IESPDATEQSGRLRRFTQATEPAHQVLCFYDIDDPRQPAPPRRGHVRDGLLFARQHVDRRLLIHCYAGISRSTALAYAILIDRHGGVGDERRLLEHLLEIRPQATPNRLMVRHADALLRRGGRMIAAVDGHPVIQETRRRNFSPPAV
ncbi:MAG: dual specificity protein phosphatase family protein, partial [Proteobacteria bacterium]|nr:dual specificity protein phosphatase family protein [Pseudomonadota bacterium]